MPRAAASGFVKIRQYCRKAWNTTPVYHESRFCSFYDAAVLIGFINLSEEENEVFFGIGAAPEVHSRDRGQERAHIACRLSGALFPGEPQYLAVQTQSSRDPSERERHSLAPPRAPIGTQQFRRIKLHAGTLRHENSQMLVHEVFVHHFRLPRRSEEMAHF